MIMIPKEERGGLRWGSQVKEPKGPKAQNLFEFIAPGGDDDRPEESSAWENGGGDGGGGRGSRWHASENEVKVANEFPVRVMHIETLRMNVLSIFSTPCMWAVKIVSNYLLMYGANNECIQYNIQYAIYDTLYNTIYKIQHTVYNIANA